MYQCTCESMSLGQCIDCAPAQARTAFDLRTTRAEARPDLLAIHDRLLHASRGFVDSRLYRMAPNAHAPRKRLTRRRKFVTEAVPGWAIGTEDGDTHREQIVILPTGEIFGHRGSPHLTSDHLADDYWKIALWFTTALRKYRLSWPSRVEDPRRLAVDFYLAANNPPREPLRSAELAP